MIAFLGDRAVVVQFPGDWTSASDEVGQKVRALTDSLQRRPLPGQRAPIQSYASVTVVFDRPIGNRELNAIKARLESLPLKRCGRAKGKSELIEIPVSYGGGDGPDLAEVARIHKMSEAEVIRLHTEPVYRVHQIGFAPGFPYLGGLSPELATPRLETPRARVPSGSVGIGGAQTGIYPFEGPGGWRIIGRTSVTLFDPGRKPPSLLSAGSLLRFVPCR